MRTLFPSVEHEINAETFLAFNGERRYDEVLREYREHPWGLHHAQQDPRFSQKYGYEHAQMLVDLGADVHPIEHMIFTESQIGRPLIRSMHERSRFKPNESHLLRLSFGTHDLGECTHKDFADIATGDIVWAEKTEEDEKKEKKVRERIYDEEVLWFIPDKQIEIVEAITSYEHELSPKLEVAERWGYDLRGITAARLALDAIANNDDSLRTRQLARMGYEVQSRHIDFLEDNRTEAEIINRWLISSQGIRERANTELRDFSKKVL